MEDSAVTRSLARPGHDQVTAVAIPAGAIARRHGVAGAPSTFAGATLLDEEAGAARAMIVVGRLVGIAAVLPLPLLGGNATLRIAFAGAVAVAIAAGVLVERRIRDPGRYSDATMVILAVSVMPAGLIGLLYFGIFSGAQLFPTLALYFFSRRERLWSALAIWLAIAAAQGVAAAVIITGVTADPGVFRTPDLTRAELVVGHALIQVGSAGAFLLGRHSHRAARAAIERMEQMMMLAAQRDALLQEARQDLERLRVGGPGRYTDQVLGAYRLGNVLGRGGMGEVYEAAHEATGEPAAVKLLALRELGNPHSVERFHREVQAVSALRSPYVVRVLGASTDGDPVPYLVMERLRGADLAQSLRDSRMPPDELDELLGQVGAAIEEAWAHGIVHRDLKPQNLFRAEHGDDRVWKVLDFGVAALGDHAGTLTLGHAVGTPAYMAPEQARGERVDHRADVYALAAISYRWLTGRPVCTGPDLHASLYRIVHRMPAQPSVLAGLHPDVDAVLAIGLAKDPAARFDTAAALRGALRDAVAGRLDPALRDRAAALIAAHPWE
jgi:eukaryotic-like serine/threonine-protein kinase